MSLFDAHWIEADPEGALKFAIDNTTSTTWRAT